MYDERDTQGSNVRDFIFVPRDPSNDVRQPTPSCWQDICEQRRLELGSPAAGALWTPTFFSYCAESRPMFESLVLGFIGQDGRGGTCWGERT